MNKNRSRKRNINKEIEIKIERKGDNISKITFGITR